MFMQTVKDVFNSYKINLNKLYEDNEIEAITLLAINDITGFSNAKIKAFPEIALADQQSKQIDNILSQLELGTPIQYVLGTTEFYGLPFLVNPAVLIPRPETEELVAWIITTCKTENVHGSILDMGTGSGCIAISLKKNLPFFEVSAIDISEGALDTATKNAKLNEADIKFFNADILNLESFKSIDIQSPISVIVSNPPYVTLHDKMQMHTNVTDFEPHTALFVPEDDPLVFYRAIANFAALNLCSNGLLFFEINESLGKETVQLLSDKGFIEIELRQDMSGRDRMIKCTWNKA